MGPLRFTSTGNCSHMVSYPAWHHCVSTSAGNCSHMVSYTAWHHCVSPSQETFRIWFPIRHGTIAFHLHRKLFAYGFLSGIAPLRFNLSRKLFAYGFLYGMAPLRFNLGRKLL